MNAELEPELVLDGRETAPCQIRDQLRTMIQDGSLHPGEELPTVRAVAVGLGVPPGIVQEAYDDLASEGLLDPIERASPRVLAHAVAHGSEGRLSALTALCQEFMSRMQTCGFTSLHVLRMLRTLTEREERHE
jgi:DNA-binding transcriptional regulator YhcF (GntR family)